MIESYISALLMICGYLVQLHQILMRISFADIVLTYGNNGIEFLFLYWLMMKENHMYA